MNDSPNEHKLRVGLVTDADAFAGTERHILQLAGALKACSIDVSVVCPEHGPLARFTKDAGITHVHIPRGGPLNFSAARILQSQTFDILHAHNGMSTLWSGMAIRSTSTKLISSQHFLNPSHTQRRGVKRIVSNMLHAWLRKRISHHIAVSNAVRDHMLNRGDVESDKITVVPNGIDPIQVEPCHELVGDRCTIVCVSRLEHEKGVDQLIEAVGELAKRMPGVRCAIVGDGAYRADLERLASELNLNNHIDFLGHRDDAHAIIAAGDVLAFPSAIDSFGLTIVEAMALAKPVVAMNAGGPREIVIHGETGYLAEPDEFADHLGKLLTDPDIREQFGRRGRQRFEDEFTSGVMAQRMLAVYRRIMG